MKARVTLLMTALENNFRRQPFHIPEVIGKEMKARGTLLMCVHKKRNLVEETKNGSNKFKITTDNASSVQVVYNNSDMGIFHLKLGP
jgi:hypothetical protein